MTQKVMIFSSVHPYDDARVFHKQAKSLARHGYDVELHALADFAEREEDGVQIIGVPKMKQKWRRLLVGRMLYKRALKSGADIFHFHDPELLPWGVRLAKRTGKPVIYDSHEDLPKQIYTKPWIPARLRGIVSKVIYKIEKGLSKRLAAVITATESIRDQFTDCKQVVIIKNYPLLLPTVEKQYDGVNRVLYIGGISYLRGYREMIKMMDYIPTEFRAELHLIGPLQHIQESDQQNLAEKNVFLHGRIPFFDVQQWLTKGKVGLVCLHPIENYRESLPIKMFEYMAAGLPLVATDFPMWKEIVESSRCGLVTDALDPKAMAEKVTEILKDPSLQQQMGESGRLAHENTYNWFVEEKKLIQLYENLI